MPSDWTKYQNDIRRLYLDDRKPLREVRRLIQGKYGFKASTRAYRSKFVEWGFKKGDNTQATTETAQGLIDFGSSPSFIPQSPILLETSIPVPPSTHLINGSHRPEFDHLNYPSNNFGISPMFQSTTDSHWSNQTGASTVHHGYPAPSVHRGSTALIDARGVDGRTALVQAVAQGNMDEVRSLLSSGAAIDIQDNLGDQALHVAAKTVPVPDGLLKLLIDYGARGDAIGAAGKTPVHLSATSILNLKILLKGNPNLSIRDHNGNTALHYTCDMTVGESTFEELVRHGADVNALNSAGQSPFHEILETVDIFNRSKAVLFSLQHGADIRLRNSRGRLPFEVYCGNISARLTVPEYGWYTEENYRPYWTEEVKTFLAKGASPEAQMKSGQQFFHHLIEHGLFSREEGKQIGMLICRKADPHIRGLEGNTSMHQFLKWRHKFRDLDPLELLVKCGSDPNALNDEGMSPLALLFDPSLKKYDVSPKLVEVLLNAGANPFAKDLAKEIPVYAAAKCLNSKSRQSVLKEIMRSVVSHEASLAAMSRDQAWWQELAENMRRARVAEWNPDAFFLQNLTVYLPEAVSEAMRDAAGVVLAEEALAASRKELIRIKGLASYVDEKGVSACRNIIQILRFCRDQRIEIDPTWYQLLLDVVGIDPLWRNPPGQSSTSQSQEQLLIVRSSHQTTNETGDEESLEIH